MSQGSIAERVRDLIPVTYQMLLNASYYGPMSIQRHIDVAKFRFFGTVVAPAYEATVYDHFTLDYVAKVSAIRIIPAGADYWSDQMVTETAREQTISFPDRIKNLWDTYGRLLQEVRMDQSLFEKLHPPFLSKPMSDGPLVDNEGDFLTVDPADFGSSAAGARFGKPYIATDDLPWSHWG